MISGSAERISVARAAPNRAERPYGRYFYTCAALLVIAVMVPGLGRGFYLRPAFHAQSLRPLLIAHAVVMSLWFILFLVQSWLVSARYVSVYQRLGWIAAITGVAVIGLGVFTAVASNGRTPVARAFLTVSLGEMALFAVLAGCGIAWRRQIDFHRRLMLLSSVATLPAAVARIPVSWMKPLGAWGYFGLTDLLILTLIPCDTVRHRRLHPAFLWGGLFIVASHPLRFVVGATPAWDVFRRWLIVGSTS